VLFSAVVHDWDRDDAQTLTALLSQLADDWSAFHRTL
jgi:hypothetical protein